MTRFCINPKDPTFRFAMTDHLMAAGFVECPPPGVEIPPTLMSAPGGILDQTAAKLATTLRKKMGDAPTEAQVKLVTDWVNAFNLESLEKYPPQKFDPAVVQPTSEPAPEPIVVPGPANQPAPGGAMLESDQDPAPLQTEPVLTETREIIPETGETIIKDTKTVAIREMTDIPLVEVSETADEFTGRIFGANMKSTGKEDILNYGLKKQNVDLDMSKTKPQLIKDLQMLEIYDASQKG